MLKFGLILATRNRSAELERFLKSLIIQTYRKYEVVIVDQNDDYRALNIIKQYEKYLPELKYIHTPLKGLSRARNLGIKMLSSDVDIVAFPDDDCIYPHNLLESVAAFFNAHRNIDFISVPIYSENGATFGRWPKNHTKINKFNIYRTVASIGLFIKKRCVEGLYFDANLGAGAPFGSSEEHDYILRMLISKKCNGLFVSNIYVIHSVRKPECSKTYFNRAFNYGMGRGAWLKKIVLYKEFILFPLIIYLIIIQPLGGIVTNLVKNDKCASYGLYQELKGIWLGFVLYSIQKYYQHE